MLYESNAAFVLLSNEITYLQNYLDLEKLRFGDRLSLHFAVNGTVENARIPPMILILLLENSFKHGVRNNLNQINIFIQLDLKNDRLSFAVKNPVPGTRAGLENNGIGLKNARRRLDLLFEKDYSLVIVEEDKSFTATLNIPVC
jgi:LytS/YehU family sensor histidine kinase